LFLDSSFSNKVCIHLILTSVSYDIGLYR